MSVNPIARHEDQLTARSGNKPSGSEDCAYQRLHLSNENSHWVFCPARPSKEVNSATLGLLSSVGTVSTIAVNSERTLPARRNTTCNCALVSLHFPSIRSASDDEAIIIQLAISFGLREAIEFADMFGIRSDILKDPYNAPTRPADHTG